MPTLTETKLFANGSHSLQAFIVLNVARRIGLDAAGTRRLLVSAAANLTYAMDGAEW
jgi:hypothetical protein